MKRILTLTLLALFALSAAAQPDTPVVKYLKGDIRRAAFNTHSYEFEPVKDTPAPKGPTNSSPSRTRPPRRGTRRSTSATTGVTAPVRTGAARSTSWSATSSPRPMSSIS